MEWCLPSGFAAVLTLTAAVPVSTKHTIGLCTSYQGRREGSTGLSDNGGWGGGVKRPHTFLSIYRQLMVARGERFSSAELAL